jgi:S1-C subfamily serine protease
MLTSRSVLWVGLALVLCWVGKAAGEDQAAIIQKGKQATALVDVQSREFGTAFCVDPSGLFVTNAHVVKGAVAGGHVSLVLQPGETSQKVLQARILRSDEKQDLALLMAEGASGTRFVPLEFGNTGKLFETAPVTAFGYPFGRMLAEQRGAASYPNITVSMGHVTSLRKLNGELEHIQLDASLNPGNSGGPVLDAAGQVVGIVQAGIYGSGVNLAIPVDKLDKLLETPEIAFDPPALTAAASHEAVDFPIKVASLGKAKSAPLSVQFFVRSGSGAERSVAATYDGSIYHAKIVPIPPVAAPSKVQLAADFAGGSLTGSVRDATIRCGARQVKLTELQRIDLGTSPAAILMDGSSVAGPIGGLEALDIDLGGLIVRADLSKATAVRFTPSSSDAGSVNYRVTVSRAGKVVADASGMLLVNAGALATTGGSAGTPVASSLTGVNLPQDRVDVKLPAMIDDVVVGGSGRFLILPMSKLNKVAVFDVKLAKVVQYLPMPPSEVLVAAGADKLFIVLPEQRIIQRWNLNTLQRELTTTVPVEGTPTGVVMGSASRGPLLMRYTTAGVAEMGHFAFIDPHTLHALPPVNMANMNMILMSRGLHARASASGDVFGMWSSGQSPSGVGVLVMHNNKAESHYEHTSLGSVVPGPDGQYIFTGGGVLFNQQLRPLSPEGNGMNGMRGRALIPSEGLGYYISLPVNRVPVPVRNGQAPPAQPPSLYLIGNDQPLTTLPALDELATLPQEQWTTNDFTLDKRVHFFPTANLLVTIPTTNDALVLRKFDVIDALNKSGIDYLFVSSTPITTAHKGELYRYPLEVKSKRGGVSFKLESGPEGMTISPAGVLTWQIPREATDSTVIVTVRDSTGQEVFHTFTIAFPEVTPGQSSLTPPNHNMTNSQPRIIPTRR